LKNKKKVLMHVPTAEKGKYATFSKCHKEYVDEPRAPWIVVQMVWGEIRRKDTKEAVGGGAEVCIVACWQEEKLLLQSSTLVCTNTPALVPFIRNFCEKKYETNIYD